MKDTAITLLTVGHAHLADWHPMPVRPHWRLYWNPTPGACIRFGRNVYRLDADMLLLMPPRTAFQQTLEAPCETLFIHFLVGTPADRLHGHAYPLPVTPARRATLDALRRHLVSGTEPIRRDWLSIAVLTETLSCIPEADWPKRIADPRIANVVEAIEAQPELSWNGEDFAGLAHMSINGMTRLFRAAIGTTPQQYLQEQRLSRAASMLHRTELSIDRIAAACGFSERGYFTRVFSARFRMGPAAWRRQSQQP